MPRESLWDHMISYEPFEPLYANISPLSPMPYYYYITSITIITITISITIIITIQKRGGGISRQAPK